MQKPFGFTKLLVYECHSLDWGDQRSTLQKPTQEQEDHCIYATHSKVNNC